jgi:hypothetical protein
MQPEFPNTVRGFSLFARLFLRAASAALLVALFILVVRVQGEQHRSGLSMFLLVFGPTLVGFLGVLYIAGVLDLLSKRKLSRRYGFLARFGMDSVQSLTLLSSASPDFVLTKVKKVLERSFELSSSAPHANTLSAVRGRGPGRNGTRVEVRVTTEPTGCAIQIVSSDDGQRFLAWARPVFDSGEAIRTVLEIEHELGDLPGVRRSNVLRGD